jgi:hypothetical protein
MGAETGAGHVGEPRDRDDGRNHDQRDHDINVWAASGASHRLLRQLDITCAACRRDL